MKARMPSQAKKFQRLFYSKESLSILTMVLAWESFAHFLRCITPYADTIMPTIESTFGKSLPGMAIFWGAGMPGKYGVASYSYLLAFGVLGYHSLMTFSRIILGYLLGGFAGVGLGLAMKIDKKIGALLTPLLFIRLIPIMPLIPLFIVWFGSSELGIVLFMTYGVFASLFINTVNAIDNVPPIYQKFALTLGATRWQLFRTVIMPAIIPELMGGVKVMVGGAWALSLAAEFLAAPNGLGRLIILSRAYMQTGQILIVLVLYVIYSIMLLRFVDCIGFYLTRWMPKMKS